MPCARHGDLRMAAEQARPANAVAGPAPATGVVPSGGKARSDTGGDQNLPSACIFQASHSLRSGVRAMRWCST